MQTPTPRRTFKRFATVLTAFVMVALLTIGLFVVHAADQSWDGGTTGNGSAWYTLTNWAGDAAFPGSGSVTTNADIATIPSTGTNPTIGINGSTNATLYLGAINFTATTSRAIGNSSATGFTLQLNGATVNAVSNVILRNSNTATLTLQNNGGGAGAMGIALGNATDNIINIDGSGGITISSIIKNGTGSKLTRSGAGAGTLTLNGVNTYNGDTTINSGRLSLGTTGSIANSPNIVLAGGSTFDVSTLTTALTLASGQGLKAIGSASTGTIATAAGKGLTTAANSPLQFTAFNGAIAPITISGGGTVTLASDNPTTVTVANGGTPLAAGDYILIAKGASGSVAGAAPTSLTVNGDGIAPGAAASLQIIGSQLVLQVAAPATPAAVVYVDDDFTGANGTDPDGAGPATSIGYDAFATIQGGATGVASGGTVNVAAGTYTENVTLAKPLTLIGAGTGVVTLRPALSAANPCTGASLCAGASNLILVQASDVTIGGLTLDGDNPLLASGISRGGADIDARNGIITNHALGTYSNLEVHHATIKNIYLRGVYNSTGGAFNFHDNTVENVQGDSASIGLFNFGGTGAFTNNTVTACNDAIASNHSRGTTYTGNTVTASASGIHTDNAGDLAGSTPDTITGNTVSNSAQFGYGIWTFVPSNVVTVSNNTVTNVEVGLTAAGGRGGSTTFSGNTVNGEGRANATGVYLTTSQFGFGEGNTSVIFRSNTVNGNVDGFYLEANETASIADKAAPKLPAFANIGDGRAANVQQARPTEDTATATYTLSVAADFNRITGNSSSGVAKAGAGVFNLNFENNWWGCNAGPNAAGCQTVDAAADFTPWLVLSVSASPNPITPGGTSAITADLRHNSDNAVPSSTVFVPPTPVAFSATNGTITPTNATTANGDAAATFTSTSTDSGTASATVDNQTTGININVAAPAFSIDDVTHMEGNSGTTTYTFTITRTGATSFGASVDYATVDGTATAPSDYTAISATSLAFTAAETSKEITVTVNGDPFVEPDETFTVHLSNATGASIGDADGTGTIQNDDAQPSVVYVDDDWVGFADGTDPDGAGGPATSIGHDAFPTIQGGVDGVATGGTVNVAAGAYDEDVNVNKTLSLLGAGAGTTSIRGPIGGSATTVFVTASNVTVAGFTITRLGNNTDDWNNPGLNSAGVAMQGQAVTGVVIRDNVVTGNRNGLDINNSNGHTVRNNVIDFNRTGIIYRNQTDDQTVVENFITNNWTVGILFLDASNGTNSPVQSALHSTFSNNNISANWYGQIVDRQTGGSLPAPATTNYKNFIGNWYGTTAPVVSTANSAEPGYAAHIPVAYGGSAVPPGGQPDIAGAASANFKYTPFLQSGTDTNVETTPGRGTNGFQGVSNTLVVSPANLNGWAFFDDNPGVGVGTGGFEEGPATPPLGAGSAFLQVDDTARHALGTTAYAGTRFVDLSELQYASYQNNSSNPAYAPSLQFDIDYDLTDTTNPYQGRLVFEPYQAGSVQQNTWQNWDALAGNWYGTRATVPVGNANVSNPCQQATPCTRQQVLALFPNAGVRNTPASRLLFKAGGPWPPSFRGNVDAFKIGVGGARVVYDFEPLPNLSINDVSHAEGDGGTTTYTFTVTLSRASDQTVTVDYATADDTATVADNDYTAVPATALTFAPGETTKEFNVLVNGDTTFEPNESFFVNLSNASANAAVPDAQGTGTITNDDGAPTVSINDATVAEPDTAGTSNATFTVSLSNASSVPLTVDYQTADGTAVAPGDYNALATTTLTFAPGETSKPVTVTINADALTEGAETFSVNLSNPTGGATIADATGAGTIADPAAVRQVLISEFRFRGPVYNAGGGVDGSRDEYVELYNNTDEPLTVAVSDNSAGWAVAAIASDGTSIVTLATIPSGTTIPARGHYLVAYSETPLNPATGGYSLNAYGAPDLLYQNADIGDNAGVALFRTAQAANFTPANRLDAAGFNAHTGAAADMFREGAGLVSPGANDGQYAFARKLTSGLPQDTDNNTADFVFVSTDGGIYGGVQSILGAPGPEDSGQPIQRNSAIKASLIDGTVLSTSPPNRVRSGQVQPGVPNAYGTLSIQRRFKNTTGLPVTRLRFRVVDITTLNSPVTSSPQADLRVLSSTGVVTNSQGDEVVTVTGLTLETPPVQSSGGGLNSSLTVVLPGGALAPGNSIDVQFLLGVQQQGSFRFLVNVEALTGLAGASSPSEQSNMKNRSTKTAGKR